MGEIWQHQQWSAWLICHRAFVCPRRGLLCDPMAAETQMLMGQMEGRLAVVVAYEDRVTRDRVIRIHDRVKKRLGEEVDFVFNWWRFDHLRDAGLFAEAVRSAVDADLILISAHAGGDFPRPIKAWINAWGKQRTCHPGALGALIGLNQDARSGVTPRHFSLRQVAERLHLDFLSQVALPLPDQPYGSVDEFLSRGAATSHFLEDILAQSHFRRSDGR